MFSISSLVEMLTVGADVQLIQYNTPVATNNFTTKGEYYSWVLVICVGVSSSFVLLMVVISCKVKFGEM